MKDRCPHSYRHKGQDRKCTLPEGHKGSHNCAPAVQCLHHPSMSCKHPECLRAA